MGRGSIGGEIVIRETFEVIAARLQEAMNWLRTQGIDPRRSRLGIYLRTIQGFEEARRTGTVREYVTEIGHVEMNLAVMEALEYGDAFHGLRTLLNENIGAKFLETVEGPAYPQDESPASNRARNILFELNLAARLSRAGIVPTLGEHPDIAFRMNQVPLFVHCKRPFATNGIDRGITDARDQLLQDLAANPEALGIIALSTGRIPNPGNRILVGENEAAITARLDRELREQYSSHERLFKGLLGSRIVGALFHISTAADPRDSDIYVHAQHICMFSWVPPDGREDLILRAVHRALLTARN